MDCLKMPNQPPEPMDSTGLPQAMQTDAAALLPPPIVVAHL
jgi:hypothetical protein